MMIIYSITGPFSNITETIFADKEVLNESYQPKTILERNEEIEDYRYALQDILFGREPENIMLYGKAGLGKTAVTTYMMNALNEEVKTREEADDLHIHEANCNGKTLFMVVRSLVTRCSHQMRVRSRNGGLVLATHLMSCISSLTASVVRTCSCLTRLIILMKSTCCYTNCRGHGRTTILVRHESGLSVLAITTRSGNRCRRR